MGDDPKESSEGYPEEQPEEVAGDESRDDREKDKPDEGLLAIAPEGVVTALEGLPAARFAA